MRRPITLPYRATNLEIQLGNTLSADLYLVD